MRKESLKYTRMPEFLKIIKIRVATPFWSHPVHTWEWLHREQACSVESHCPFSREQRAWWGGRESERKGVSRVHALCGRTFHQSWTLSVSVSLEGVVLPVSSFASGSSFVRGHRFVHAPIPRSKNFPNDSRARVKLLTDENPHHPTRPLEGRSSLPVFNLTPFLRNVRNESTD